MDHFPNLSQIYLKLPESNWQYLHTMNQFQKDLPFRWEILDSRSPRETKHISPFTSFKSHANHHVAGGIAVSTNHIAIHTHLCICKYIYIYVYIYIYHHYINHKFRFFIGCDPSSTPWMAQPAPPSKSWDHDHCAKSLFAATGPFQDVKPQ